MYINTAYYTIVKSTIITILYKCILLENATALGEQTEFYIGGSTLLCQFIEPVTFVRCAFIFVLQNIALGRYLDTRRNI